MIVDVYKQLEIFKPNIRFYILIPSCKYETTVLPYIIRKKEKFLFQKTIDLKAGQQRIAIDVEEAIKNITEKGYHEQEVIIKL